MSNPNSYVNETSNLNNVPMDMAGAQVEKKNTDILCKLFIGNIPKTASDERINEFFSENGFKFKEISIMKDIQNTSLNRGFAFGTMESEEDTDRLLLLELPLFMTKKLDIKRAAPKECTDPLIQVKTDRVFIGGLPQTYTEDEIKTLFDSKYGTLGTVSEVIPKKDRITGKSRGFCFVVFKNYHVVDKILIDNRFPYLNGKRLEIRKASTDIPVQGGASTSNDGQFGQKRTAGGRISRGFERQGRMNAPYSRGLNNLRQHPYRALGYMQGAQFNRQSYGLTNRQPPSAYADGVPVQNPTAPTHVVSNYTPAEPVSYSQPQFNTYASQPPPPPPQQPVNPQFSNPAAYGYGSLNYSATQGGYQPAPTAYQAAPGGSIIPGQNQMQGQGHQGGF